MFLRRIRYNNNNNTEDSSVPFVRFLNNFEGQKSLFNKEGIKFKSKKTEKRKRKKEYYLFYFLNILSILEIFKEENLAKRQLSRYTRRALQNRHLEVLVTLLMIKIEEEQEEYRNLMRLAEELCIEDFSKEMEIDGEEDLSIKIFKNEKTCNLDGIDPEEVLKLKALCHVILLNIKMVYYCN